MSKKDRGFASMDPEKQKRIASMGGKAAHAKETAHQWDRESARKAGRQGGLACHAKRKEREAAEAPEVSGTEMPIEVHVPDDDQQ